MTAAREPYKSNQRLPIEVLLRQLSAGNTDALGVIFDRYYQRLVYYGLEITEGRYLPQVKDVVQELFIWIAKNYSRLESIQHFEAYLFQSVKRNVRAKLQLQQKEQGTFDRFVSRTAVLGQKYEKPFEDLLIDAESSSLMTQQLTDALDRLPPHQWEVLHQRYYEGKSYKQIAGTLSIGVQVARNFASRGLKKLREEMKDKQTLLSILGLLLS